MKQNVDLTLNRVFRSSKERQMLRREACEECGEPIRIPWKEYCLKCERWFRRIGFFKPKCYLQLHYPKPSKGLKLSCRRQLNDPKVFSFGYRCKTPCRRQLGVKNYHKGFKILCRRQLRNETLF